MSWWINYSSYRNSADINDIYFLIKDIEENSIVCVCVCV